MKLVTCIKGKVWDVAVDLRANSHSFLKWHGQILSAENCHAMLIPEGFAHGFQSLSDDVELIYLHTEPYSAQAETGLRFDDEILDVKWPITITEISERDRTHSSLTSSLTESNKNEMPTLQKNLIENTFLDLGLPPSNAHILQKIHEIGQKSTIRSRLMYVINAGLFRLRTMLR